MTLLLGFAAVNTGNNLLFLIVSGLLAFMSVTGYVGMLNIKRLKPELIPPAEVYASTPATFCLRLTNAKPHLPAFLIRVDTVKQQGGLVPFVAGGRSAEQPVSLLFPKRGRTALAAVRVSSAFPVNFFTRFWTFDLQQPLIVFPALLPLQEFGGDSTEPGITAQQHQRGHEGELEGINRYSGREPFKLIHWKLSARADDLLVKEFGGQSAAPLTVDLSALPGRNLEECISQAAWLVVRWVMERPVGLVYGTHVLAPAIGRQHGRMLLTELALYDPD